MKSLKSLKKMENILLLRFNLYTILYYCYLGRKNNIFINGRHFVGNFTVKTSYNKKTYTI